MTIWELLWIIILAVIAVVICGVLLDFLVWGWWRKL